MFADFRELFHTSPAEIPLVEACLLLRSVLTDSRSRLAAKLAGWAYPVSSEWMLLAQLHDAVIDTTPGVKNPSQYHVLRPWKGAKRRTAKRSHRTAEEVRRILRPQSP